MRANLTALLQPTSMSPFIVWKFTKKTYNKQSSLNDVMGDDAPDHTAAYNKHDVWGKKNESFL